MARAGGLGAARPHRVGELFCGIGGFSLGFESAGFRTAWANDACPEACDVFRREHPDAHVVCADVESFFPPCDVDVLCAGIPCVTFSSAGKRRGVTDPDTRRLLTEFLRVVEACNPSVVVIENVTNFRKHAWPAVRRGLDRLGFAQHHRYVVSPHQVAGTPQSRTRMFAVSLRRREPFHHAFRKMPCPTLGEFLGDDAIASAVSPCVTTKRAFAENRDGTTRVLTIAERLALQGFPRDFLDDRKTETAAGRLVGNAVSPIVVAELARSIVEWGRAAPRPPARVLGGGRRG